MRVAVFSDTHGHLVQLQAVLNEIDRTGPYDEVIMAGDFALGGPFPGECIELVRSRGIRAVRGNTDEAIVAAATGQAADDGEEAAGPPEALVAWAAERLTPEQIDYLADLPLQITVPDQQGEALAVVHATPWSAHPVVPPDADEELVARLFEAAGTRALAYGHIHVQYERRLNGELLVNVGSVGLPFDGVSEAAYALFTSGVDGWSVDLRRVSYDIDAAITALREQGVPNAEEWIPVLRMARR